MDHHSSVKNMLVLYYQNYQHLFHHYDLFLVWLFYNFIATCVHKFSLYLSYCFITKCQPDNTQAVIQPHLSPCKGHRFAFLSTHWRVASQSFKALLKNSAACDSSRVLIQHLLFQLGSCRIVNPGSKDQNRLEVLHPPEHFGSDFLQAPEISGGASPAVQHNEHGPGPCSTKNTPGNYGYFTVPGAPVEPRREKPKPGPIPGLPQTF